MTPLPRDSEAFRVIQYQLQQQLDAVRVKVFEAFDVSSITQSELFSHYCQSITPINVVHAFIPTCDLQQPISDIASRGVKVNPKRGLRFRSDKVIVDRDKEVVEVVHCLVALGNVLNYQNFEVDLEQKEFIKGDPTCDDLLPQFDSLCVSHTNEYVIFNPNQIRTLHIIRCHGGELLENTYEISETCDLCQTERANCFCENCRARLCEECDNKSHSANKLLQTHTRIPIDHAKPLMEVCPCHPNSHDIRWCPECQLPVCYECKMSGHHSRGVNIHHQLIPLKDAYFQALNAGTNENRIYIRRRHILADRMRDADKRMDDVILNSKTLEARIMKIAQEAIRSLHEQAAQRCLIINSTKTEIQRKMDEVEAKSKFIQQHMKFSSPINLIRAMDAHDKVVNELRPENDLPRQLAIEGDLALTGTLLVKSKAETILPQNMRNRDVYFDERNVRNVEFPSTTFDPNLTSTDYSTTSKKSGDMSQYTENSYYSTDQSDTSCSKSHTSSGIAKQHLKGKENLIRVMTLTQMALHKEQKLREQSKDIDFIPFEGSNIIRNRDIARKLYMCFPFKVLPRTHMLFSTDRDGRSIQVMHQNINNKGITCVLIKKGEYIFGGFAACKWNTDCKPFGQGTSCFLFSLNRDVFVPYRPRIADACFLYAEPSKMTFGLKDIVLQDNFEHCVARIEQSYGIGLPEKSLEARTFFCGEETFRADIVEVWGFFTVNE